MRASYFEMEERGYEEVWLNPKINRRRWVYTQEVVFKTPDGKFYAGTVAGNTGDGDNAYEENRMEQDWVEVTPKTETIQVTRYVPVDLRPKTRAAARTRRKS